MRRYRSHYDLSEVAADWSVAARDVLRLGEIGQIRFSVFVHDIEVTRPYDRSTWLWDDGSHVAPVANFEGLVDLFSHDVRIAARRGSVDIRRMKDAIGREVQVTSKQGPITILKEDLVLRGRERKDFEQIYEARYPLPRERHSEDGRVFQVSGDYRSVWLGDQEFRFGEKQAHVIKLLHEAARRGEPRQSGKRLLARAGSKSRYVGDLFSERSQWRALIDRDGAGNYWLKINLPDADERRPTMADFVEEALSEEL